MNKKELVEWIEKATSEELEFVLHIAKSLDGSKKRYFDKLIGIERNERITLKPSIFNKNSYGIIHGGAIGSLIDISMGTEISKTIGYEKKIYTIELKMNFMKATFDQELSTETKILYLGSTTIVAQCHVKDAEGDIVAAALGTFYIVQ